MFCQCREGVGSEVGGERARVNKKSIKFNRDMNK